MRRLALLLALEGVALVALGIGYGVAGLSDDSDRLPTELAAGAAVVVGLALLVLARATDGARSWARAPAVTLNVFPFPVALGVLQAGVWWVGVPMVLLAATVLYLWATPDVRAAFATE